MPDVQPTRPGDPVRLGANQVLGRIGKGGQGIVYLGEADSGGLVAIKHLHAEVGTDAAAGADVMRELEAAKRVARFCTVQVLEAGIADNRPYIVSEYVEGPSLHWVVTDGGPRSGGALERLAVGTATALVALHDAGIIHRDLKPHNVLIGPDGPRVIDFGIARLVSGASTMTNRVMGTPAYMAPEQLAAGELGVSVDVFAWAGTIVFAATGGPPFGSDGIPAVINRILHQEPDLGPIERPLRDLLAACLAKDPSRRPSARQILDHLVNGAHATPVAPPMRPINTGHATPVAPPPSPLDTGHATPVAPPMRPINIGHATPVIPPPRAVNIGHAAPGIPHPRPIGDTGASRSLPKPGPGVRRAVLYGVAAVLVASAGTGLLIWDGSAKQAGADQSAAQPLVIPSTPEPARPTHAAPTSEPAQLTKTARTLEPAEPSAARSQPARTPHSSPPAEPTPEPTTHRPATPKPTPTKSAPPPEVVELGPGNFTAYCQKLGWEWVEYRETPTPGEYCVIRKGDKTMKLTQSQLDAGCQWRYNKPDAFQQLKGKSNYCYRKTA
jgi:serine/threonine protein kinase